MKQKLLGSTPRNLLEFTSIPLKTHSFFLIVGYYSITVYI